MQRVLIALSVILGLVVSGCSHKEDEPVPASRPAATVQATASAEQIAIPADQRQILDTSRAALALVAQRSASAAKALAFYDRNAVPAKAEGGSTIVATLPTPDQPTPFFVDADPRPLVVTSDGAVFAHFVCHPTPGMRLRTSDQISPFVRGVLLAHELEHATDCLLQGEPDTRPLDDNWLLGEFHAHSTVFVILNETTKNGWGTLVKASQQRRQTIIAQRGARSESSIFGQLPEDVADIKQLFGDAPSVDMGFYLAQLDIDANVENVKASMALYGLPDTAFVPHCIDVLRLFYTQHQQVVRGGAE